MLSRLAVKALRVPGSSVRAMSGAMSTAPKPNVVAPWDGPERDLVNFPRRKRPIHPETVRLGFLPEEWFTFFYDKTGVTGPYMFMGSVSVFLLSKEFWILDHEFYMGIPTFGLIGFAIYKFGPQVREYLEKEMNKAENELKNVRQDEIDRCVQAITDEEKFQYMATSYETLIQAKKENVALQLEAAYRERLQHAYQTVKLRLDYQLEIANVMRRIEQKHMVDWIITNVKKNITAKQEDDALKKCVQDLKGLSTA